MNDNCNNLDAYLADDLTAPESASFAQHLHDCEECRETVDQQQWIDSLLQSPSRAQFEPAPSNVVAAMKKSLSRRQGRQFKFVAVALAVAAVLMVAVGWTVLTRQAEHGADASVAGTANANDNDPAAKIGPRATFVSNSSAIAVPIKSRHADVTVVRIYPTYRPRYENQTAAIEPEAASNKLNIYSTGG